MTPEDRNYLRAEGTLMILAAMYTNRITPPIPRDETEEQAASRQRRENVRRMGDALEAANAADAAIAELILREEAVPLGPTEIPPEVVAMHGGHIPEGAHIVRCLHGRASWEPCADCDAADAAEKAAAAAKGGTDGKTGEIAPGGAV